ncbi:hypothetical protein GCM10009789_86590 [Kribbella sancticallisti]|uniref:LysR substrate-binding domain-containing protein n=1 Tax=Kribbella sancticallisti TaxID=460087 RepID=A0ABN2EVY6_9ACTN
MSYDYNLAPASHDPALSVTPLWQGRWSLAVPSRSGRTTGTSADVLGAFADRDWIVNSRNTGDEQVVRTLAALAGFEPRITQRADSLSLVQDMILAGLGVALLPGSYPKTTGISLRRLPDPEPRLRAHALTRRGRPTWPPLRLLLTLLSSRR